MSTKRSSIPPSVIRLLLLFASLLLVAGCSSELKRIHLAGVIETAEDLNPNYEGEPSPVVVRLYQLRTIGAFQSADFFSLIDDEASALGEDLIAREEIELRPGERIELNRDFDPRARYIGVVAAFRDLEKARWRAFAALPHKARVGVTIHLDRLAVELEVKD